MAQKQTKVEIPDLEIKELQVEIEGTASLIVHRFGEKARKQILDIQNKKAKTARPERDPHQEYLDTLYKFNDGVKTGFPAVGFKAAMVRGAKSLGLNMTDVRGAIFVKTDEGDLVEIKGDHIMRTDMVRVGNGGSDIRYRGEYPVWSATLNILYNAAVFSAEQVATIVRIGGFAAGIGEWRPEKSNTGSFGTWDIVHEKA
jgi:hypothetical protein